MENGTLKNKASLWQSNANWTFTDFNGTLIRIKNNAASKFLEAQWTGQVLKKDLNDTIHGQFWIQGEADTDGYITLENSKLQNHLLTAVSKNILEVKSKQILFHLSGHFIKKPKQRGKGTENVNHLGKGDVHKSFEKKMSKKNFAVFHFLSLFMSIQKVNIKNICFFLMSKKKTHQKLKQVLTLVQDN